MFYNDGKSGFLTVIVGPMASEKSGELISKLMKAEKYQKQRVCAFKPNIDNRFADNKLVSRIGLSMDCENLDLNVKISDVEKYIDKYDVFGIDEIQFFDKDSIISVINYLLDNNKHVMVCGLALDYLGNPFGCIGDVMAIADEIIQKYAYCTKCGRPAIHSQMIENGVEVTTRRDIINIGTGYEPRCRLCFKRESE